MTVYRVTYTYMGDKMHAGTYDTKAEAVTRAGELKGFQNVRITPQVHHHHKYCGHAVRYS